MKTILCTVLYALLCTGVWVAFAGFCVALFLPLLYWDGLSEPSSFGLRFSPWWLVLSAVAYGAVAWLLSLK